MLSHKVEETKKMHFTQKALKPKKAHGKYLATDLEAKRKVEGFTA